MNTDTSEIPVVENTALAKIVQDSGLELNEAETIKQSYQRYFNQIAEIKELSKKINFENPTELDEKIARDLRLRTVKIRTGSESVKEERKKVHALKANIEQSAWNLIKTTCQLDEELFLQVEKKREIAAENARKALAAERLAILSPLTHDASIYPLGTMTAESFESLVNGLQLAKDAKEKAEREAEAARIEALRIEAEKIEAQRIENEKLKAEAAAREAEIEKERAESLRLQKESELKAKAEREAAETALKAEQEKARKELEIAEAKLKAEAAAKAKIAAELQAKKDAEMKAEREAAEKALAEMKAKDAAEKKAAKAPDKTKLTAMVNALELTGAGELKTEDAKRVATDIANKFLSFKRWAESQIETL